MDCRDFCQRRKRECIQNASHSHTSSALRLRVRATTPVRNRFLRVRHTPLHAISRPIVNRNSNCDTSRRHTLGHTKHQQQHTVGQRSVRRAPYLPLPFRFRSYSLSPQTRTCARAQRPRDHATRLWSPKTKKCTQRCCMHNTCTMMQVYARPSPCDTSEAFIAFESASRGVAATPPTAACARQAPSRRQTALSGRLGCPRAALGSAARSWRPHLR